jgi:hypothetical protein
LQVLGDRGDLVDDDGTHGYGSMIQRVAAGAGLQDARQAEIARVAERVGRGPLAGGLAVDAARGRQQRCGDVTPSTNTLPGRSSSAPRR